MLRGSMDGCCCNVAVGLRLRMATVAMDAQGIRALTSRLGRRYVLEAMSSHNPIERNRTIALPASIRQPDK